MPSRRGAMRLGRWGRAKQTEANLTAKHIGLVSGVQAGLVLFRSVILDDARRTVLRWAPGRRGQGLGGCAGRAEVGRTCE